MNPISLSYRALILFISLIAAVAPAADDVPEADKSIAQIPYRVDHDAPLDSIEKLDREADGFSRLRIEFNGIRGDRVPAYLYLPRAAPAARPAILLQYGSGGNKNTNYIVAFGEHFAARGFVVLTIDAPLRGERKPKDDRRRKWWQSFTEAGRFPWYLGDYSRAVDYLLTRQDVDHDRVGYVGISWGAITGITFVAHEPRVRAMASIVGGGNFLGTLRTPVAAEAQQAAMRVDPIYHVAQIAPRPLLLINATRDQLVPRFYADSLHRAAGDAASVTRVWLETDHFFNGVDRRAVMDQVIDFITDALR